MWVWNRGPKNRPQIEQLKKGLNGDQVDNKRRLQGGKLQIRRTVQSTNKKSLTRRKQAKYKKSKSKLKTLFKVTTKISHGEAKKQSGREIVQAVNSAGRDAVGYVKALKCLSSK